MTQLSPEARLMLARYRNSDAMKPQEKERLLDAIVQRSWRGDFPPIDLSPRDLIAPTRPSLWGSPFAKAAVFAIGGAVAVSAVVVARGSTASLVPNVASDTPFANGALSPTSNDEPAVAMNVALPVSSAAITAPQEVTEAPRVGRRSPGVHRAAPPTRSSPRRAPTAVEPAQADTIDAEVSLLNAAQGALNANMPGRALQLLEEHATRFPNGKLVDARGVTRMLALCSAGQRQQARQEAQKFLHTYPSSPFAARVKNICAADVGEHSAP